MDSDKNEMVGRGVIFLAAISMVLYCLPGTKARGDNSAMETTTIDIPPIDRAVPATHETATFGLG
jgi:hypothetical protein